MLKAIDLEPVPFDMERDLITPTFKLKRPQLLKYYQVLKMNYSFSVNFVDQCFAPYDCLLCCSGLHFDTHG